MSKWKTMETAPKDDTEILVYGFREGELGAISDKPAIHHAYLDFGVYHAADTEYYSVHIRSPTHWMPLPKPPGEEK